MFCPKCKSEYVDGFDTCADCGSGLIEQLPNESESEFEYVELIAIAETNNLGLIALAKSILTSEGIKYYINDMYSYIPGPSMFIKIHVPITESTKAKELLKDIGL